MEDNSKDSEEEIKEEQTTKEETTEETNIFPEKESIESLKLEITNDILKSINKKEKNDLLTIVWKLTPLITLLFLIGSYFYSVKPIFDKSEELKSKTEQVELLIKQINSKETDLKDFTKQYSELNEKKKLLEEQIENQRLVLAEYQNRLSKSEILLSQKEKQLKTAESSAILVHLKKFTSDIFPAQYKGEKDENFDIRAYTLEYISLKKDELSDDIYGMKALDVLKEFAGYKSSYDIERSIYFLNLFFEYSYGKKK
ncbi:hypothetical protein [Winogradskyella sp. Asnod2-B02-A]|uniref:hypothetical protein n=1 Tax=Winogradskyella sp. Asnod2-B02-A TaxID=3160583 RepID=UPI00386C4DE5